MLDNISFYCLGAAHTDIKARALIRPKIGDSIPVTITKCAGGVACNIAVNLTHCGARVALASRVGNDPQGHALLGALALSNIDTRDIGFSDLSSTGRYYALLTPEGELFVAMADMSIYDEISPALVKALIYERSYIPDWIIDANILGQTIKIISNNIKKHQRLWGVGVSTYKTQGLAHGFPNYYGLIINQDELFALSGRQNLAQGMLALRAAGCFCIVVTAGALGVYYCNDGVVRHRESSPVQVVDVTGAGDAFSAGVIYSMAKGQDFEQAIDHGLSLAQKALLSNDSCLI